MAGVMRMRFGIVRVLGRQQRQSLLTPTTLPIELSQKCNISGKSLRGDQTIQKPKPYPYKTKKYGILQAFFDKTSKRLDDNSKIICVEGPIAGGKTKFAKELAEELEMFYMPQANMDSIFINSYGYDMRQLDSQLNEMTRSFDDKNFCKEPNHPLVAQFQVRMYMLRYGQYVDALQHVLSTGQGVVMDRCAYSDFVFVEAMTSNGYMSKGARSAYYDIRENTIGELLQPHLVIYLDTPVKIVKERIAARNIEHEIQSKVFTDKYLTEMELFYKQHFLRNMSVHSELLVYDWSVPGETEVVVEDIERIDFSQFEVDRHNKKMKDWRFPLESEWCAARIKFCNEKYALMNLFNVPRYDVPELLRSADDGKLWRDVWFNAPGMKYSPGYNSDMGDTGIWTKTKLDVSNGF